MEKFEDTYPLSPMQEGMLFHSLYARHSGVDIEQLVGTLREKVDVPAFRRAWQKIVERHAILRTAFHWEGLDRPIQEVRRHVVLSFAEQDWSDLSQQKQAELLDAFLKADRCRGFAMEEAPLMRLALFRLSEAEYRLVWTFHHALLDGRSFAVVLKEVFAFYEARLRGKDLELSLPRPYRDYIDWLYEQDFSAAESFWRQVLKGFAASTPLAVGAKSSRGIDHENRAGDEEIHLSIETTSTLGAFAENAGVTLNTVVQGAWALLLNRYSDEEDVIFGATRACRRSNVAGAEMMVGIFINTLPMRVRVNADAELVSWLKDLRAQWVALRDYEHTPLVRIQNWSQVPTGMPLFESIVVFEKHHLNTLLRAQRGGWLNREFRLLEQPNFPVTLAAYGGDELCLKIEFDRGRFGGATVRRMLGHLRTLLEAMAAQPQQRLGELPLLTEAERRQLFIEWNEPQKSFPSNRCLHELFEAQVSRAPEAVAAVCDNEQLTYQELNFRANQLAHHLRRHGVGQNNVVGICMERSLDLVVGILGILKAGGAYLPIDPSYPAERMSFMLKDAQASVLVTQQELAASLPVDTTPIICIDAPQPAILDCKPTLNPVNDTAAESFAYVIYTSGSTGKPKGVMVTHHNAVRLFQATQDWFHFNDQDVWTLFHSCAFDFSVWEIFGALLHGGRLVVVPYLVSRSPEAFYDLLSRSRVTILNQTPSAFRQLIQAEQTASEPKPLALRYVIFGGEALEMQSLKPWFDRHGDESPQLANMYGVTETTVHVTYRLLRKSDLNSGSVIGVPIPDLQVYILDRRLQPVPIEVPGELFVGGAGVARGYLNRADLTAERFIRNPFSNDPAARLYRTGDRARFLPNRDIEYIGRMDHQVKIRGFRIEPGEIESLLRRHPAVREAVVIAREDQPGDKRLVAYFVSQNGARASALELRAHLKDRLPDYMVPSVFVVLDELPLTPNGKVDRRALPGPDQNRPESEKTFAPPRTRLERKLAAVWRDALCVDKVGVDDNFFEMGGHSLLLIQVHGKLRLELNRDVPIVKLFQHPTIRSLAGFLSRETDDAAPHQKIQQRIQRMQQMEEVST
jgi:amino acid adenylation domain-containing protein